MRLRTKRLLLYLGNAVTVALAVPAIYWSGWGQLPSFTGSDVPPPVASHISKSAQVLRPTQAEFQELWDRRLRRPLIDPITITPPPAPVAVAEVRRRPVKLLGTMVEPGASMAVLLTQPEGVQVLGIGQTIAGQEKSPTVARIEKTTVDLKYGDEVVTLTLEQE